MIELSLTKPQVRLILRALEGPSVDNYDVAVLYECIKRALDDEAPISPWRKVVSAYGDAAYRGDGIATNLKLECGHYVRQNGTTDHDIKRLLDAGKPMRRRCHECRGGPSREGTP